MLAAPAAALLLFGLGACNSSPASNDTTDLTTDMSSKIVTDLALSTDQATTVRTLFGRHNPGNPGELWTIAAELAKTLTAEQKAQLLAMRPPLDSARGEMPGDMEGGCHHDSAGPPAGPHRGPGGPGGPGGPPPELSQSARDSMFAAMVAALGLTETQQQSMKDLFDTEKAAMDSQKAKIDAGELTPEQARAAMDALRKQHETALAAILTADQLEIAKIHDALMARAHGGPGGPPPPGGPRGHRG
jgi:hypothetical protein